MINWRAAKTAMYAIAWRCNSRLVIPFELNANAAVGLATFGIHGDIGGHFDLNLHTAGARGRPLFGADIDTIGDILPGLHLRTALASPHFQHINPGEPTQAAQNIQTGPPLPKAQIRTRPVVRPPQHSAVPWFCQTGHGLESHLLVGMAGIPG